MRKTVLGAALVLVGGAACVNDGAAEVGGPSTSQSGLQLLSQSQLRATIVGSTITQASRAGEGITVYVRYSQTYRRDGTLVQWVENAQTIGTYRFSGNSVCSTLSGQTRCWYLLREGTNYWQRYSDHPHQIAPILISFGE